MSDSSAIGRRFPLLDAVAKATGQARFSCDMALPGMLHGKVLRSPVPHALLLSVDTSRAERLRGVKAVITGRDTAGVRYGYVGIPEGYRDKLALALEKVRYIGDSIAAVAAVDADTAQEALGLIKVDLEELPAVFDPEEALNPGAPQVHDHVERNMSRRYKQEFGEVEDCFRKAYHIREDRFVTQATSHVPLETHSCVAHHEPPGRLTVWTSTQAPFYVQDDLAMTLQLPESNVRVIKPVTGGGFGGKADGMDDNDFCASLLSILTGRPVRITYTREEEFLVTRRRHPTIIHLRAAVARDGTILSKECRLTLDGGAYNFQGGIAPIVFSARLGLPYRQQALRYEAVRAYTNKSPSGAMRGFGSPQMHFAQDVQMELIARDMGMDPVELRLKNGLEAGEKTVQGFHVFSSGFKQALERLREASPARHGQVSGGPTSGWGMGCTGFPCGSDRRVHPGTEAFSEAIVRAHSDGTVTLLTGASDVGQGCETTLSLIVAEELGILPERVRVIAADTALTPMDLGTYSSRVTMMAGNASLEAARRVKEQLMAATAQSLEANVADLVLEGGRIGVKGTLERGLTFAQAVGAAHKLSGGNGVAGQGVFNPMPNGSPSWSFGANGAEVWVDLETGQVSVQRMAAAHDCGVAINPMAVEGQLEGSVHMGVGFALSEKLEMEGGQILNPSLLDYKMATPLEMPEIEVLKLEVHDPIGPFGAKEAGEGTVGPTAPAIANAVHDATGLSMHELPITPEKMLRALEESVG